MSLEPTPAVPHLHELAPPTDHSNHATQDIDAITLAEFNEKKKQLLSRF